jgi:hypothetical protein
VVNQAESNTIQPPGPPQYILVDHRIGEEVDQRVRRKAENVEFDCVAICVKPAVGCAETLADSTAQLEAKGLGDLGSEQTE